MPCDAKQLTAVVLTPHSSNFSNVGVGALGVSMNSNSLSEPLMLWGFEDMIAVFSIEFGRTSLDNPTKFRTQVRGRNFVGVSLNQTAPAAAKYVAKLEKERC
jgi:hypothetical protein